MTSRWWKRREWAKRWWAWRSWPPEPPSPTSSRASSWRGRGGATWPCRARWAATYSTSPSGELRHSVTSQLFVIVFVFGLFARCRNKSVFCDVTVLLQNPKRFFFDVIVMLRNVTFLSARRLRFRMKSWCFI